jgi:hypothetical protein
MYVSDMHFNKLTTLIAIVWEGEGGWALLPWSYGSCIYNYLCNQCLSPLMLWVRISIRARCTTLDDKVCHWLATGLWFSLSLPASSTKKTDRHNITEILLKVALNTIKQTNKQTLTAIVNDWKNVQYKLTLNQSCFISFDVHVYFYAE